MPEKLGLGASVAIALGGMIGGGIYAVLGVVTTVAGAATWFAFALAGAVALCTGYSYVKLDAITPEDGGSVTFIQCLVGNSTLAGMAGWTLLFGYVGSMAMYAFAFAAFAITLPYVPETVAGVSIRPPLSVAVVAGFVGLNLLGARATGAAENVLVAAKVLVLVLFGLGGLAYGYLLADAPMQYGLWRVRTPAPVVAAGVSFVAFQGWQLLFYDQESIADADRTVPRAVYLAILAAVAIYVLVAVATYNLAPAALAHHPHTALADAAAQMLDVVGLASLGGLVISLSALFSTGSAINATLFSAGYFAKGMLAQDLLPDQVGDPNAGGVPRRTLLGLGVATAAFAAVGSLGAITNFASVAFVVVFGGMSALALRHRDRPEINPVPPAVGLVGAAGFLPLMLRHLYTAEPNTFYVVLALAAGSVAVELLYFERGALEEEVAELEADVERTLREEGKRT